MSTGEEVVFQISILNAINTNSVFAGAHLDVACTGEWTETQAITSMVHTLLFSKNNCL
jgi:hypothetical protein